MKRIDITLSLFQSIRSKVRKRQSEPFSLSRLLYHHMSPGSYGIYFYWLCLVTSYIVGSHACPIFYLHHHHLKLLMLRVVAVLWVYQTVL